MTTYAGRPVFAPFFVDAAGNSQVGVSITVYNRGTVVKPTLYTSRTKATVLANPFTADSLGNAVFYVDPGEYDSLVNGVTLPFTSVTDPGDVGAPVPTGTYAETQTPGTTMVAASVADRIALDARVAALESGGGATPVTVLEWDTNYSVLHGDFWPPSNVDLGPFSWEAWLAPSAVRTLLRTSTGGTITITLDGQTTAPIPASPTGFTKEAVQAALVALSNIDAGDVTVRGPVGGFFRVSYHGRFNGLSALPTMTVNNASATGGTVTVATVGAEYWISEGFGGAHALLAGFGGGPPFGITGNVYNGVSNTSFSASYQAQMNEWMHVEITWDGTSIWVLVNGIVCGKTAFAGPRRSQFGQLMIGGSEHSNFVGRIAQVRAWEGQTRPGLLTYGIGNGPDRYFADERHGLSVPCQFATSYINAGDTFPDLSAGFGGRQHPGHSYQGNGFSMSTLDPHPSRVVDTTAPFGNQFDVARTRTFATPAAVPSAAKIWDSFGRDDSIEEFSKVPTPGSTEGGSLGVLPWEHTAGYWGIFDGCMVGLSFSAYARVPNNSADMDVRVGRVLAAGLYNVTAAARITANLLSGWVAHATLSVGGVPTVTLTRPDNSTVGVDTPINATWTHLRLVTSGTTITVYVDDGGGEWELLRTATGETANQTEVGAGVFSEYNVGTAARFTDFEVR